MQVVIGIIIVLVILYIYYKLVEAFFVMLAPWLVGIGLVGAAIVVAANYMRALWEGLSRQLPASLTEAPYGKEPAYKNYYFRKAYQDVWDVWLRSRTLTEGNLISWLTQIVKGLTGFASTEENMLAWIFIWPLIVVLGIVTLGSIIGAAVLFTGLAIVHIFIG